MREWKNLGREEGNQPKQYAHTRIGYIYVLRGISSMSTKKRHRGLPNPFHTIGSGDCGDGEPGEIQVVGKWVYVLPPRYALGKAP